MADFQEFNFKLLVIEKLMYADETLTPRFRLADLVRARGLGGDPWSYAYAQGLSCQVIPEARAHSEALEIDDELLATVDELIVDGGLQVYQECAPVWDGEDDLFDVVSPADLDLLPRLGRVVSTVPLAEELRDALARRGVAIA
ncbi:DUF6892 domain-containing protein [Streptomyces sp. NPDC102279]|uniref:DUF6892 domain-containing protein n=1 Tax=Streptomyces sp. NPDC102279 TaxID=3366153 RepID=UPI003809D79C